MIPKKFRDHGEGHALDSETVQGHNHATPHCRGAIGTQIPQDIYLESDLLPPQLVPVDPWMLFISSSPNMD